MKKVQAGRIVIGNEKIWTFVYAVDIVFLAKKERELKEMMKFKKYLDERNLELNAEKSKVFIFKKRRGKKKRGMAVER